MAQEEKKSVFGRALLWGGILALKSTKLLKLSKLTTGLKALKVAKPLLTFGSMAVSVFAYSFSFGWQFAAGFVALLFLHEMGHVIALRHRGYNASSPVFIPFLGAAIFVPKFNSSDDEAYVGIGGPLLGTLASVALYVLYQAIPSHPALLLVLAYTNLYLNLFNLIPMRPLDGGRVLQAVSRWLAYIGVVAFAALILITHDPWFVMVLIMMASDFRMSAKRLAIISSALLSMMLFMVFAGFLPAKESVTMLCIGVGLATLMTAQRIVFAIHHPAEETDVSGSNIPYPLPPARTRVAWFAKYTALVGGIIFLMSIIGNHLPEHVKASTGFMLFLAR